MSDPTYRQMIEDVWLWARAGYPAVACGRYRDAAERIKRLESKLAEAERVALCIGPDARKIAHIRVDELIGLKADAERYRLLREHVAPKALFDSLGGDFWEDVPRDQPIASKVDALVDAAIDAAKGGK